MLWAKTDTKEETRLRYIAFPVWISNCYYSERMHVQICELSRQYNWWCLSMQIGRLVSPTYGEYTSALDKEITGRPWCAAAARIKRVFEFPEKWWHRSCTNRTISWRVPIAYVIYTGLDSFTIHNLVSHVLPAFTIIRTFCNVYIFLSTTSWLSSHNVRVLSYCQFMVADTEERRCRTMIFLHWQEVSGCPKCADVPGGPYNIAPPGYFSPNRLTLERMSGEEKERILRRLFFTSSQPMTSS